MDTKKHTSLLYLYLKDVDAKSNGSTSYVKELAELRDATSIEQAIEHYNSLLKSTIILTKGEEYFETGEWYKASTLEKDLKVYLEELNYFLNACISRLYDKRDLFDGKFNLRCLVNLREAPNRNRIFDEIIKNSPPNVLKKKDNIIFSTDKIEYSPEYIKSNDNSQKNRSFRGSYFVSMNRLVNDGYIKSIRDVYFGKKIGIDVEKIKAERGRRLTTEWLASNGLQVFLLILVMILYIVILKYFGLLIMIFVVPFLIGSLILAL